MYINMNIDMNTFGINSEIQECKNSISDAYTPQPGEIVFNTMTYRCSETVQRSGYFRAVSVI